MLCLIDYNITKSLSNIIILSSQITIILLLLKTDLCHRISRYRSIKLLYSDINYSTYIPKPFELNCTLSFNLQFTIFAIKNLTIFFNIYKLYFMFVMIKDLS